MFGSNCNEAVEQFKHHEPQIIENRLVAEGGFFPKPGVRIFNFYKPPQIIAAKSRDTRFWRDHLHALWPDEASHIERWKAHRVYPARKSITRYSRGEQSGVGKDAPSSNY